MKKQDIIQQYLRFFETPSQRTCGGYLPTGLITKVEVTSIVSNTEDPHNKDRTIFNDRLHINRDAYKRWFEDMSLDSGRLFFADRQAIVSAYLEYSLLTLRYFSITDVGGETTVVFADTLKPLSTR